MADHLWFIPVSADGKTTDPNMPNGINVQYEVYPYPSAAIIPTIVYDSFIVFTPELPTGNSSVAEEGRSELGSTKASSVIAGRFTDGPSLLATAR